MCHIHLSTSFLSVCRSILHDYISEQRTRRQRARIREFYEKSPHLALPFLFARPSLYGLNLHLYKLALRGLGVLTAEGSVVTGETWLQSQFAQHLRPKTIIDVGANLDAYGAEVFSEAKIYAFEPHPVTFSRLEKMHSAVEKNRRITLLIIALSDSAGKMSLYDFADNAELKHTQPTSTLASLSKEVIEDLHKQQAKSYRVNVKTIDQALKEHKLNEVDILR